MLIPSDAISEPVTRTRPTQLTLLLIDGESIRDSLHRAFTDDIDITVEAVTTLTRAVEQREIDAADCLVLTSPPASTADADATESDGTGIDGLNGRLERIRHSAPELPVVVLTDERTPDIVHTSRSYDWTVVIERDEIRTRLADRLLDLLERHRLAALSRRSLASVEFAGDAIAVVDPTGEIEFASRSFALQFDHDHTTLPGTHWQTLFTDDAVDHLESTAIPTVREGWRWTGTCTGRRRRGTTFPARVRLGGLEDGSLVFAVDESDGNGLEE